MLFNAVFNLLRLSMKRVKFSQIRKSACYNEIKNETHCDMLRLMQVDLVIYDVRKRETTWLQYPMIIQGDDHEFL